MALLEVQHCSIRLGHHPVLSDISFSLEAGQMMAVLGRNGAGKTTLARALAGFIGYSGQITVNGESLAGLKPASRSKVIGYVAQDVFATSAQLTVLELLVTAQCTHQAGWRTPREALKNGHEILGDLGLECFAERSINQLSGGQRQMVSLALALVGRPQLLILDEPTSALDLANQIRILDFVSDYAHRKGIAVLTILHDPNLATRFADAGLLLSGGDIVSSGALDDVITPANLQHIYGLECQMVTLESGHRVVYPMGFKPSP